MPSSIHLLFQDARNHLIGFLGLSTTPAVGPQNCQFQQHLVSSERHALRSCWGVPAGVQPTFCIKLTSGCKSQVELSAVSPGPMGFGIFKVFQAIGPRRSFSGSLWAHAHALGHGARSGFGKHPRTQLSSSLVLKDYPVKFLD